MNKLPPCSTALPHRRPALVLSPGNAMKMRFWAPIVSERSHVQALAALDRYIVDRVAPLVQSGITLFNTAAAAPVLPTRCPG